MVLLYKIRVCISPAFRSEESGESAFLLQKRGNMAGKNIAEPVRCSFCNKPQEQVRKLIAGPNGVYICDGCIEVCADILQEELDDEAETLQNDINLLKPEEIKRFLDEYVIGQEEAKKVLSGNHSSGKLSDFRNYPYVQQSYSLCRRGCADENLYR